MKALENITRSQIEQMNRQEIESLMNAVVWEDQDEKYRAALLEMVDKLEARIVTPKLVT